MSRIRIGGINGQVYEMPEMFTYREMRLIKRMTGLPAGRVHEAANDGDTDVIAAFALVAMMRDNKTLTEDSVLDLRLDEIEFLDDEESTNGDHPTPPTEKSEPEDGET